MEALPSPSPGTALGRPIRCHKVRQSVTPSALDQTTLRPIQRQSYATGGSSHAQSSQNPLWNLSLLPHDSQTFRLHLFGGNSTGRVLARRSCSRLSLR